MTRFAMLSIAILFAAPAAAQDLAKSKETSDAPAPGLKNLLQNCDAHKFETTVESVVDGKPHQSKVKMCGTEGQSDADWINSLKDAIAKLQSNSEMPAVTREQIIAAVKAEIARLEGNPSPSPGTLPPGRSIDSSSRSLTSDYSVLPPLSPASPPPSSHTTAAAGSSSATPMPASPVATPPAPMAPLKRSVVPAKPRLDFSCISPEFPGGGPCVTLTRDTILTVRAGEALPAGIALHFFRSGRQRDEVALGSMRKGQSLRFAIPQAVCSGAVSGEVEMAIVRSGQVVDRRGPYLLRC